MTGRHAAPRDELFDQRERETAGSHRADIDVPLGPDDVAPPPAKKPAARAKPKTTTSSRSKKAGTT